MVQKILPRWPICSNVQLCHPVTYRCHSCTLCFTDGSCLECTDFLGQPLKTRAHAGFRLGRDRRLPEDRDCISFFVTSELSLVSVADGLMKISQPTGFVLMRLRWPINIHLLLSSPCPPPSEEVIMQMLPAWLRTSLTSWSERCCWVQSLSCVWLLATPWTAAGQVSLSFTISWGLLRLKPTELVMPFNHLISFGLQYFPASGFFLMCSLQVVKE